MARYQNIEEYIEGHSGTYAYPILIALRALINEIVPAVEEKIKWGSPSFEHKGLMIGMVVFKNATALWFHRGAELTDPLKLLISSSENTQQMRKVEFASAEDIDEKALRPLIMEAWQLNESGRSKPKTTRKKKPVQSGMLQSALSGSPDLLNQYQALPLYKQQEFAEYIEEAKREETRKRRLEKSREAISRGLGLNDKYR